MSEDEDDLPEPGVTDRVESPEHAAILLRLIFQGASDQTLAELSSILNSPEIAPFLEDLTPVDLGWVAVSREKITHPEHLPRLGARESQRLEFKKQLPSNSSQAAVALEIAKDIAALANSDGGAIIYGATGAETLHAYTPFERTEAEKSARTIEHAARDLCSPQPQLGAEIIEYGEKHQYVIVVNVEPYPGAPIGIRVTKQPLEAWSFPARVGTHTKFFDPSALPIPESREIAVQLSHFGKRKIVTLRWPTIHGGVHEQEFVFWTLDWLNRTFKVRHGEEILEFSLSEIRSVEGPTQKGHDGFVTRSPVIKMKRPRSY